MDRSQADRETRLLSEGREKLLAQVAAAQKKGKVAGLPYQHYLIRQIIEELAADIKTDAGTQKTAGAFKKFAQYLGTIDPMIAALRAIQAVLGTILSEGAADIPRPIWKVAARNAGKAVYNEYLLTHFQKLSPALFNSIWREFDRNITRDERLIVQGYKKEFTKQGFKLPTWEYGDIEQVGNYLLTQMQAHAFIESWSKTEHQKGKAYTMRYMRLNGELHSASLDLLDRIADAPRVAGALIEPPKDWDAETNTDGGFHTPEMQRLSPYAVQGNGPRRVGERTVSKLNTLQRTQWTINSTVLATVQSVAQRISFGDLTAPVTRAKPEYMDEFTPEQKKAWKAEAREWYKEKKVKAVKALKAARVFSEARALVGYPTIWFSYYADFRGRAYARSASVSPQGTDLEKGLLRLKNGKRLDSASAVRWFKLAGAGRFGLDKVPFSERLAWVEQQRESLLQIAADPQVHTAWTSADSPVQFLAWVFEFADWVADPASFESHLPMGQDGTCNGLQHFSALMCDHIGGAAVNLVPGAAPRDIYSDVAVRVTDKLQGQSGPFAEGWLAHGVNRKITKRPTMTLPYGSTRYAASQFIMDYMEETGVPQIEQAEWGNGANYLSHVVWGSLGEVVVKAMEVMDWLKAWAKDASKKGKRVSWTTPDGLRVTSEYEKMKVTTVKSIAFKSRIKLFKPLDGSNDGMKTGNAVAPNFVHSLDAAHLTAVIERASAEGMEVVAIHDDFGVHAADTERFHEIIRETFVEMYEGNTILQTLADSTGFETPPPELGELDLRQVLHSPYFFH